VLNAVVSHEELTLDEAVLVLQYPPQQCLSLLEQLRSRRYVQFVDGRYRVDPLWDRAAVRYLRRKHLLYK
jgi:DNA-binding IclR family transcriptional regulator